MWGGVNNIIGRHQVKDSVLDTTHSLDYVNDLFHNVAVSDDHQPSSSFPVRNVLQDTENKLQDVQDLAKI